MDRWKPAHSLLYCPSGSMCIVRLIYREWSKSHISECISVAGGLRKTKTPEQKMVAEDSSSLLLFHLILCSLWSLVYLCSAGSLQNGNVLSCCLPV